MDKKNYTWVKFMKEFAKKLLEYKDDREKLVGKLREQKLFEGISDYKVENSIVNKNNIDPFTIFYFFNGAAGTPGSDENRKRVLKKLKKMLSIDCAVPEDFDGIPIFLRFDGLKMTSEGKK